VVFSGTPVSSTNKTDNHDITEILLKVVLNTITLNMRQMLYDKSKIYGCVSYPSNLVCTKPLLGTNNKTFSISNFQNDFVTCMLNIFVYKQNLPHL